MFNDKAEYMFVWSRITKMVIPLWPRTIKGNKFSIRIVQHLRRRILLGSFLSIIIFPSAIDHLTLCIWNGRFFLEYSKVHFTCFLRHKINNVKRFFLSFLSKWVLKFFTIFNCLIKKFIWLKLRSINFNNFSQWYYVSVLPFPYGHIGQVLVASK